jgi:hypothetical protein
LKFYFLIGLFFAGFTSRSFEFGIYFKNGKNRIETLQEDEQDIPLFGVQGFRVPNKERSQFWYYLRIRSIIGPFPSYK